MDTNQLERFAADIRIQTIRMFANAGYGHIGGAMSIADVLAVLYGGVMSVDPKQPLWEERDRLVLSKGHSGPALYAAPALKGYFPLEELNTLNQGGTKLPSHCDRLKTPGIDMTTGSLGQGVSCAMGIAMGLRMKGRKSFTYLIMGDGELQEGQVWEGVQFAAHQKLDRLIAFVDDNKKQLGGWVADICNPFGTADKFSSFGWHAQTVKGYDVKEIYRAVELAKQEAGKPSVIILDTLKGKGCCFAENVDFNHYMTVSEDMAEEAIQVIENSLNEIDKGVTANVLPFE
ncbi:MAG: transketolase [Eubacteriales bacterium]|nr:transketolase [Eubacteriales bacterium]